MSVSSKPELKRLDPRPALKRQHYLGINSIRSHRDVAPDPFANLPAQPTNEKVYSAEFQAIKAAFRKQEKEALARYKAVGEGSDNFCVVFESGAQAEVFLRTIGYPDLDNVFIDGTILAQLLSIRLPKPEIKIKPIRKPDQKLARLITEPKFRNMHRA